MSIPQSDKVQNILIGLVGVERSGKDTIADFLVKNYGFKKYSLASPIREIGKLMFGWSDEQLNGEKKDIIDPETCIKPRDFLTWFGTDICQYDIYNRFPSLKEKIPQRTIWANMMGKFIKENIYINPIIITDIRFNHEVDIFQKYGGIILYVSRKEKETISQLAKYDLNDIINSRVNYVFDNNSDLESCKQQINILISTLLTNNTMYDYDTSNCNIFI